MEFLSKHKATVFFLVCAVVFLAVVWKSVLPGTPPEDASKANGADAIDASETEALAAAVVQETHDIGNYTILKLGMSETDHIWIASPPLEAYVGDFVVIENPSLMADFYSSSLDRTFPEIYFVEAAAVVDKDRQILRRSQKPTMSTDGMPGEEIPAGTMTAEQMANASGNGGQDQGVNVAVLEPPADGISIAQLNQNYAEQAGQEVTIRGTVVKATPGILGTNWYHLQDGSAAGAAGDVIVTSNEQIPRGGIVTVSGIVEINNEKREFMQHDFIVKAKSISNEQSSPDKELP